MIDTAKATECVADVFHCVEALTRLKPRIAGAYSLVPLCAIKILPFAMHAIMKKDKKL